MNRTLQRKLWRDFLGLRGQALAIALVVIGGVAMVVMALSNHRALYDTRERFYQEHHYADVFVAMRRAPVSLVPELGEWPGVAQVQGRIVVPLRLEIPGVDLALSAQAVSLATDPSDGLNRPYIREGLLPRQTHEVLVGESFARAHGLHPGDRLVALLNGRRTELTVSGTGLSPEFIYQVRPGELFPDFERFAVLWMPRETLATAFDLDGAINHISLALAPGAVAADLIDRLDERLAPYGGLGATDRSLQISHRFIEEELQQLHVMSRVFGGIFLGVAGFLLHVVITRVITTQREQIAVLKAFGYRRGELVMHYGQLVILMVTLGVVPGVALGSWLGRAMAHLYADFYRFPYLNWSLTADVVGMAVAFGLGAALAGTAGGLWQVMRLAPAQAMRPEAPARYRPSPLEALGGRRWWDGSARMAVRQLTRRPWRTTLSVLGIALSCAVLVLSQAQGGAIDKLVEVQFQLSQREDMQVTLTEPRGSRALQELESLDGVQKVEGFRTSPVRLENGHRHYVTSLTGMDADATLRRVMDVRGQPVALPAHGLLLTDHLARRLNLGPGDQVRVVFLDGRRESLDVNVAATAEEYLGVGAYAQRSWFNRLRLEDDLFDGAWLSVAPDRLTEVRDLLGRRPTVATINERSAALQGFRDTLAENLRVFTLIATLLAASIAVGVVYNAARLTLAERARDLASLRIMGYTRSEVRQLLLDELGALTLLSLVPGCALGAALTAWLFRLLQTDLYRIPLVLAPAGFAFAATVVLVASVLAAAWAVRRLDRLDLVAVLKTRE